MSLRYAVLGILSIQPMSGYELKKVIDHSVGHFWAADQSQVYRTLAGLVEEGLASRRTVVQDERPNLHVHNATERGLAALDEWLASPLRTPPKREPFLARLFFADRLPPEEIRELLESRRREASEQLAALEAIVISAADGDVGNMLRVATLENGIAHTKTELSWLATTLRRLDRVAS